MDPSRCVVLVPINRYLEPECARGLAQLEVRGYQVRAVPRYPAIDQGRSQMATDALLNDFDALMWIDSDVGFDADAVDRLREHNLPIVCGISPEPGERRLDCWLLPDTPRVLFGEGGGPIEIRYSAMDFCYTQRVVYETMIVGERLPVCNKQFGRVTVPYFLPLVVPDGDEYWYLNAEYSFCERARRSGFDVIADTRIRLDRIGRRSYFWEDAGLDRLPRHTTYEFNVR